MYVDFIVGTSNLSSLHGNFVCAIELSYMTFDTVRDEPSFPAGDLLPMSDDYGPADVGNGARLSF